MKTLDQVEARTAITNRSSLVTILQPGSYYLTGNLTVTTGDGIIINTNGVTLDLNGFTIRSSAASATGTAITFGSGLRDITILNGHIRGSVTNNGGGVYSGSGFANGIYNSGISPLNVLVSHISVSGCLSSGINLNTDDSRVVEACTVRTVGAFGIVASNIKSCSAVDCGGQAISGDQVSDSRGESTGNSTGLGAAITLNCYGQSNGGSGLTANSAQNCYGKSNSGIGLYVNTAQNCYGSSSSGTGLNAVDVATGCRGISDFGTGLSAFLANGCRGSSLSVTHNVNSF